MKTTIIASLLLTSSLFAEKIPFYIGTSSTEGVYRSTMDTDSGELTDPFLVARTNKPSALALSPDKQFLYTYGLHRAGEPKEVWNTAHAFRIEDDHSLANVGTNLTGSTSACHLSAHPDGKIVFFAHYGTADVSSLKVSPRGILSSPVSVIKNTGTSVHPKRQQKAHSHSIYPSPDGNFVYSADLGTDEVLVYSLDQDSAELQKISAIKLPAGSGPRHMTFSPDGSTLYVLNELTLTVSKLQRNAEDGSLSILDTKPATTQVPPEGFTCSEIHLTADGKFLYIAKRDLNNTGKDTINLLSPETLEIKQEHPAGVWVPRHFNLSPSGKWLVVAGQKSDNVTVHSRDLITGKLSTTAFSIDLEQPSWILFPQ